MIHLTDKYIAVEIPDDATEVHLGNHCLGFKSELWIGDRDCNNWCIALVRLGLKQISEIVGVTPLTEEQWDTIVYKFGEYGYMNYLVKPQICGYLIKNSIESGISLLKSKGLDPNKKYAIIKIEKDK